MAPKDSSSAPKLELGPDSPLQVVARLETEAVPFVAKAAVPSLFGKFVVYGFLEKLTGKEHIAIVSGDIDARKRIPVRIHSECWTGDVMGSLKCDCRQQLEAGLRYVGEHGGIVLYLRQEGRGIGLLNKLKAYALQETGLDTVEANQRLGFADDLRSYESAVEMLRFFGIHKVRLLTNNPKKIVGLEGYGLVITEKVPIEVGRTGDSLRLLEKRRAREGYGGGES